MAVIAFIAGSAIGLIGSLVPGLHMALLLIGLIAIGLDKLIGAFPFVILVAAAAGTSLYAKRLGMTYHPSASAGNVLTLDPALRLTRDKRGRDALFLARLGTDIAWIPIAVMVFVTTVFAAMGGNLVRLLDGALGWIGIPLILLWAASVIARSKHKLLTFAGFCLAGGYGYATLHHPATIGGEHSIAPILTGVFGLTIAYGVWRERRDSNVDLTQQNQEVTPGMEVDPLLGLRGAIAGCGTGFFAGLGASSLVALVGSHVDNDEDYLIMGAAGEAANDIMAILLVLAAGLGRSGEAVLLGRKLTEPSFLTASAVFISLAVGAWIGRKAIQKLEPWYQDFILSKPPEMWIAGVCVLSLVPVVLAGWGSPQTMLVAFALTGAGLALGLWLRANHLSVQVSFATLAIPLVLQATGLTPALNLFFFGS